MVRNRQGSGADIPEVGFAGPDGTPAGIEVLSLARLRSRTSTDALCVPHRPAFHHLLTLSQGAVRHTVDFTEYAVTPGAWLWVRPGQVHRWGDLSRADGTLILFEQNFLDPATTSAALVDDSYARVVTEPADDDLAELTTAAEHLDRSFNSPGRLPADIHIAMLRHLLAVLVLRLAHAGAPAGGGATDQGTAFSRFRDAVERTFTQSRRLENYAHALGYSTRTLSRATQSVAGVNAKDFIDRRVILEAKRLLAHGDHTAAQIAARLGFTSATNFGKYFHQRTGTTPIAFRNSVRGDTPATS